MCRYYCPLIYLLYHDLKFSLYKSNHLSWHSCKLIRYLYHTNRWPFYYVLRIMWAVIAPINTDIHNHAITLVSLHLNTHALYNQGAHENFLVIHAQLFLSSEHEFKTHAASFLSTGKICIINAKCPSITVIWMILISVSNSSRILNIRVSLMHRCSCHITDIYNTCNVLPVVWSNS